MTQTESIKKHLKSGKYITPLQALKLYGCMRLAARIYDLRKTMKIKMSMTGDGLKSYSKYYLK